MSRKIFHLPLEVSGTRPNECSLPIVFPKKQGDKVPPVRTQARSATILPNFVGLKFEIHNGKDYHQITITEDMVGHKLGEFSPCAHPNPRRVYGTRGFQGRLADMTPRTRKPHIWDKK